MFSFDWSIMITIMLFGVAIESVHENFDQFIQRVIKIIFTKVQFNCLYDFQFNIDLIIFAYLKLFINISFWGKSNKALKYWKREMISSRDKPKIDPK